jgi:putative transposase
MIERDHPKLAIVKQCALLSIGRSSYYREPKGESPETLALMAEIDRQFLETPFYGVRQMTWHLRARGWRVNVKRVRRLMRLMRLMPIYRKSRTSIPAKGHGIYLHAFSGGRGARAGIGRWVDFYNHHRPHAAHGGRTPALVYRDGLPPSGPGLRPALRATGLAA